MNSNRKLLAVAMAAVLMCVMAAFPASAAGTGDASIGFSNGGIRYVPYGISGIEGTLGLSFGNHEIDSSNPVEIYASQNKAGYVVSNSTGGEGGYTVTLRLSPFDNGLEGASLILRPDGQGLISDRPGAVNPPILLEGRDSVELEADGISMAVILEGRKKDQDPDHTALGRWGSNFEGNLVVYTSTILAGESRALMTWELTLA